MGRLTSYSSIASKLCAPKAARAVGAAVGRTRFHSVPCHRVVGGSGALTGYLWGITRKHAMLGGWKRATRDRTDRGGIFINRTYSSPSTGSMRCRAPEGIDCERACDAPKILIFCCTQCGALGDMPRFLARSGRQHLNEMTSHGSKCSGWAAHDTPPIGITSRLEHRLLPGIELCLRRRTEVHLLSSKYFKYAPSPIN